MRVRAYVFAGITEPPKITRARSSPVQNALFGFTMQAPPTPAPHSSGPCGAGAGSHRVGWLVGTLFAVPLRRFARAWRSRCRRGPDLRSWASCPCLSGSASRCTATSWAVTRRRCARAGACCLGARRPRATHRGRARVFLSIGPWRPQCAVLAAFCPCENFRSRGLKKGFEAGGCYWGVKARYSTFMAITRTHAFRSRVKFLVPARGWSAGGKAGGGRQSGWRACGRAGQCQCQCQATPHSTGSAPLCIGAELGSPPPAREACRCCVFVFAWP